MQLKLYAVDDDPMTLDAISSVAETLAHVECFDSAEACAQRVATEAPDLFLLDVELGGMNGYEYCRQLKADPATADTPVIFVSSHDGLEDRLQGYDAGGEDFIVKPFEPQELLRKIKVAEQMRAERLRLLEQAATAEELSNLALASLDEGGLLLNFMIKLVSLDSEPAVAQGLLELMQRFKLDCTVQTRIEGRSHTLSKAGANLPLEVSIMSHMQTMDRVFEFHDRSAYNFERVSIMISNMPIEDPDWCGRIRDNVAIAAQSANARLAAIENAEARLRSQGAILNTLDTLRECLADFREKHKSHQIQHNDFVFDMERELQQAFVHLGLTMGQETFLEDMVKRRMQELIQLSYKGEELEGVLATLLTAISKVQALQ